MFWWLNAAAKHLRLLQRQLKRGSRVCIRRWNGGAEGRVTLNRVPPRDWQGTQKAAQTMWRYSTKMRSCPIFGCQRNSTPLSANFQPLR